MGANFANQCRSQLPKLTIQGAGNDMESSIYPRSKYPGLRHGEPNFEKVAHQDPEGVKRAFYTLHKLRKLPFRYLQEDKEPDGSKYIIRPGELHKREGRKADICRFRSWIYYVRHFGLGLESMENLHVYTAHCDAGLPLYVSFEEILQGKYGRMDEANPLRVVQISGKTGRISQPFPRVSFVCGWFSHKDKKYIQSQVEIESQNEEDASRSRDTVQTTIQHPLRDVPPTYEEAIRQGTTRQDEWYR